MDESQKQKLSQFLIQFQADPRVLNNGVWETDSEFDAKREEGRLVIKKIVDEFIGGEIDLIHFKETNESLCRRYSFWGFKGMSGQMQLNQYTNNVKRSGKEQILRVSVSLPESETDAKNKLNQMASLLQTEKEQADNKKSIPRVSQLSMLSYFWEIQDPDHWPAFYGSTKKVLSEIGLELTASDPGSSYLRYKEWVLPS